MVALPLFQSHTAIALDKARADANIPRDGLRLPASRLGDPCDRALWYSFRWVSPPKAFEGRMLRLFEDGQFGEDQLVQELRNAGFTVIDRDERKPDKQISISFADGHGFGYLDGEIIGIPEAPKTIHVLEIKTHKSVKFNACKKHGVEAKHPDHFAQMMIYMHKRNRTRALYLFKNKDTSEVDSQRIEYDYKAGAALEARAEKIVYSEKPLPKLHEDPDAKAAFACQSCDHLSVCHGGAFARKNCRTCIWSTPARGGNWVCERRCDELSREDQAKGCNNHLFIPDLVPGNQVDADIDAGWILYAMADGSTWRNEVAR